MTKCTTLAAVLAISLMAGCVQNQAPDVSPYPPVPPLISRNDPEAAGDGRGADVAARTLGLERHGLCLGKGAICASGWARQPVDAWMVVAHPERLDLDAAALAVLIRSPG